MKTTRALREAVTRYLEHVASDHPAHDAVAGLTRGVLLARARIVWPSLRREPDEEVIHYAVKHCTQAPEEPKR